MMKSLASVFTALAICGCTPPPQPAADQHLIDRFQAIRDDPATPNPEPQRISVAGSERLSLVTEDSVHWQAPAAAEPHARGAFAFSLTVPLSPEATAENTTAILEWTNPDGQREELFRTTVTPGTWIRRRVPIDGKGGDWVLRSEGPVAWAELHWLPATVGTRVRRQRPPDLVLISIDTLRADHLSAYGYHRPTSPNLERLANESLRFTHSLSSSTWTLPSTATLLTGLLPAQHGLRRLGHQLNPRVESVAERLRRHGYRTIAITDGGFVSPTFGFSQGFERYDTTDGEAWAPKDVATIVERASKWIEENHFYPYFLFVHTYETHMPYTNAEGYADLFLDPSYDGRFQNAGRVNPQAAEDLDEADRDRLVDLYDGEIRRADHYIGRFVERLRSHERWPETAVVVTSDHGEEFRDHGDFDHGFGKVFDANVRVPLIVKTPEESPGQIVDIPVSGLDVAPTLLTLAGASVEGLAGHSLVELASQAAAANPKSTISEGLFARPVLVHGTNSFPDLFKERYRLDLGHVAVIFNQVTGKANWYDLTASPWPNSAQTAVFSGPPRSAAQRLQAVLAWSSKTQLLARLPEDSQRVVIAAGSKVKPSGAFSGLVWSPAKLTSDGGWTVDVDAGRPQILTLEPAADGRGWDLQIEARGSPVTTVTLRAGKERSGWHPFDDPLPEPGALFPASMLFQPEAAELSPENLEELKALGYL